MASRWPLSSRCWSATSGTVDLLVEESRAVGWMDGRGRLAYTVVYVRAVDLVQHTDRTDRMTPKGRRGDGVGGGGVGSQCSSQRTRYVLCSLFFLWRLSRQPAQPTSTRNKRRGSGVPRAAGPWGLRSTARLSCMAHGGGRRR